MIFNCTLLSKKVSPTMFGRVPKKRFEKIRRLLYHLFPINLMAFLVLTNQPSKIIFYDDSYVGKHKTMLKIRSAFLNPTSSF